MRILLIEDDRLIGEAIRLACKDAAYAIDWVKTGEDALNTIATQEYGLALLDLGLPGQDGLEILKQLRRSKHTLPVIIITARDSVEDRIKGLDYGADDYLIKPFATNELLARMRALIRRHQGVADPLLSNGILTLNPATREVTRDETVSRLSAREYSLLHALILRPGSVLSRSELEERIYGWNEEIESNAVEFLIHALRKKLGTDAIKNIRGLGWMVSKAQ